MIKSLQCVVFFGSISIKTDLFNFSSEIFVFTLFLYLLGKKRLGILDKLLKTLVLIKFLMIIS